jgi:hypothetical protein
MHAETLSDPSPEQCVNAGQKAIEKMKNVNLEDSVL